MEEIKRGRERGTDIGRESRNGRDKERGRYRKKIRDIDLEREQPWQFLPIAILLCFCPGYITIPCRLHITES
jgi:hypothetical protein